MMIHPDSYYEMYIQGKEKEEIMTVIRSLKQNIGQLKNMIENPPFGLISNMCPSHEIQIEYAREFLRRAKEGYAEAGGTYILSESEKKTADFNKNMDAISQITFMNSEHESYIVDLNDGLKCIRKIKNDQLLIVLCDEDNDLFTIETFLNQLKDLYIGEWRSRYLQVNSEYSVFDCMQWEVEFKYNNGHKPVKFSGINSCPYNFDKFQSLFGISET